ncbi:hypothetical protein RBSH_05127 [Rhodopirellula baltica SH28]|uniref:Uncharacterized protein n=1 Tax=Rhodopirellula baltica SH28 TaxID=993517 RepID=K5C913_RHOBT|nr:hypothetical protein RBSH_05127 [Rhodopirellula baltica SH28]
MLVMVVPKMEAFRAWLASNIARPKIESLSSDRTPRLLWGWILRF